MEIKNIYKKNGFLFCFIINIVKQKCFIIDKMKYPPPQFKLTFHKQNPNGYSLVELFSIVETLWCLWNFHVSS
jgi:hypothetical protein